MLLKVIGDIYLYISIDIQTFLKSNFRFPTKLRRTEISPILPVPKQAQSLPLSISLTRMVFFTKDKPMWTHCNYSKSTVYIRVHSWCCIFYMFGKRYKGIYPLYNIIQSIFTTLKILCALTIHLHLHSLPLETTDLFLECHSKLVSFNQ